MVRRTRSLRAVQEPRPAGPGHQCPGRHGHEILPSPARKWIMRQSLGLMLFISNPWTYGRITLAAWMTAVYGTRAPLGETLSVAKTVTCGLAFRASVAPSPTTCRTPLRLVSTSADWMT